MVRRRRRRGGRRTKLQKHSRIGRLVQSFALVANLLRRSPVVACLTLTSNRTLRAFLAALALLLPVDALAGQISLAWDASPTPGVTYSVYWGLSSGNHPNVADVGTQTSHTVQGLADNVTYYFVVRAVATGGALSSPSNEVNGRTGSSLSFTDSPLVPGVHAMKLVHMTELRSRIDALRAARGQGAWSWTALSAGMMIRASHIAELRTALSTEYQARGVSLPEAYVDHPLAVGTPIKALHITQLRALVIAIGG
jgi:hypothetical protein